jgi:uncharacterized membrane protein YpjA
VWRDFEQKLVHDRNWRWALIVINLGGALYGFTWYADQLASTPRKLWPVVPDSPLSVLAFGVVLLLITLGKRCRILEAVSYMMMIKYGLWAALVLSGYAVAYQDPTFEGTHLSISHVGMAIEAYIYLKHFHPGFWAGLVGVGWMLTNDVFDYTYKTHPWLPHPGVVPAAEWIAYGLTLAVVVLYFRQQGTEEKL